QYSLHNSPHETHRYCIAVLKNSQSRGGSEGVHRDFHAGKVISVSVPRNNFQLDEAPAETILIAGGIGITPLLSMAEIQARRGRRFALHYFSRSRSHAAFVDRIAASPTLSASSHFHFGDEAPKVQDALAGILRGRAAGAHVYICGPAGFIESAREAALGAGMSAAEVHVE